MKNKDLFGKIPFQPDKNFFFTLFWTGKNTFFFKSFAYPSFFPFRTFCFD